MKFHEGVKRQESTQIKTHAVVELILENQYFMKSKTTEELAKIIMEQFNLEVCQAKNYIRLARIEVRKLAREKAKAKFEKVNQRLEFIYQSSKSQDKRLALDTMKEFSKLNDLYPEEKSKIEHTGGIKVIQDDID